MVVLGINGGWGGGYQDTSAALMIDGKLVAAVEEERLSRIKFAPGILPYQSIFEVLEICGQSITDVDIVAFHGATWGAHIPSKLEQYFLEGFGYSPQIKIYHHHTAHAASSFFASGFSESLCFTFDNSGDGISTQIARYQGSKIHIIKRYDRPQSLGIFYSAMTQLAGFVRDRDEYKVMGLAPYGDKGRTNLDWLLCWSDEDNTYYLNEDGIIPFKAGKTGPSRIETLYTNKTKEITGLSRRLNGLVPGQSYMDLAAAAQYKLEEIAEKMVKHYIHTTGIRNICLAGGVAFNCAMNGRLQGLKEVEHLFIPPFAGDMGISVGNAILASVEAGCNISLNELIYLGNDFDDNRIERVLQQCKCKYVKISDPASVGATLLAKGKIIGWFQGRSEFGPRALGNRSILADASIPDVKDRINLAIKFREGFRPFAPVLPEDELHNFFNVKGDASPYMTTVYTAKENTRRQFPGIVHVDYTSRIQTVNAGQNALFYALLTSFKAIKGHPILVNTSFNTRNQPMVYSPLDALETFFSSGLDALIIGGFLITKD